MESVTQSVLNAIHKELGVKDTDYPLTSNFAEFGLDSLDVVSVVMDLEREFGIVLPDELLDHIDTPEKLIAHIEKLQTN